MCVRAARDHGHDSRDAQLSAFLDRPFHAIKFENGKEQRKVGGRGGSDFLSEFEIDSAFPDAHDSTATDDGALGNVEFLPHASAQDANEVIRMLAGKRGAIPRNFVGDPSAAGHEQDLEVLRLGL